MQPDPELERQWRDRAAELFARAPDPDGARLEAALESVRGRRVRAAKRQRVAWGAAAAAMLGMAGASAAWWIGREPAEPRPDPPASPAVEQEEAAPGNGQGNADGARESGATDDGPVIYRRAK